MTHYSHRPLCFRQFIRALVVMWCMRTVGRGLAFYFVKCYSSMWAIIYFYGKRNKPIVCWLYFRFYDAILAKERRRSLRFRHHLSYDVERSEFLCPLCETLSNTVIPLIPQISTLIRHKYVLNSYVSAIVIFRSETQPRPHLLIGLYSEADMRNK